MRARGSKTFRRSVIGALAATVVAVTLGVTSAQAVTVPNIYVRQCTIWWQSHCTPWHQSNGPYVSGVGAVWYTQYVWYWV